MFNINISRNTLYAIGAIIVLLLFATIMIFISFMYHTKRKYDSIDKCISDKPITYKDRLELYDQTLEDLGLKSNKERNILSKIIDFIKSIRDSK